MHFERRFVELGIELPPVSAPAANYRNAVRTGNLLFLSGKVPPPLDGKAAKGKLGREYAFEDGYRFARSAGLDLISAIKEELGSLDKVSRIVELQGFLNATGDFEEHPRVLNGCSDLFVEVFGESGVHARSVIGVQSLRGGAPLVLRAVVEVRA